MITVGLTGNVASGKTTVANRWRDAGVFVIDADKIGHAVLEEEEDARQALVNAFGRGILASDGSIDRPSLREVAFADTASTSKLDAIVHPSLLERIDSAVESARVEEHRIAVVDAALIYEFHLEEVLDRIVLVVAPPEEREERLRISRGLDHETVAKIMAAQQPDEEKAESADYVIVNDAGISELETRADEVLAAIRVEGDEENDEE